MHWVTSIAGCKFVMMTTWQWHPLTYTFQQMLVLYSLNSRMKMSMLICSLHSSFKNFLATGASFWGLMYSAFVGKVWYPRLKTKLLWILQRWTTNRRDRIFFTSQYVLMGGSCSWMQFLDRTERIRHTQSVSIEHGVHDDPLFCLMRAILANTQLQIYILQRVLLM